MTQIAAAEGEFGYMYVYIVAVNSIGMIGLVGEKRAREAWGVIPGRVADRLGACNGWENPLGVK